jgi:hypothetical protein
MGKKKKQSKPVVNKKKEKDLILRIDKLTGRLPSSTRAGGVIQGEKYKKGKDRKQWKEKLKRYVESNQEYME